MSTYRDWNNALWKYFFPKGNEDAILYLDDIILEAIASEAQFNFNEPAQENLLKNTLINDEQSLKDFRKSYKDWTSEFNFPKVDRWDRLVIFLNNNRRQIDDKPPYFAMLCAIMYLASSEGADHSKMKALAKKYLGEGYRGKKPGELIYDLMKKLHKDKNSFNPDRIICGKDKAEQRHMGRIKYHLALKANERQDFIDFLEVGNLQWNEGSYADYANNILIPALQRAKKPLKYFDIVKEYIPYVKNILQSDLNWGKNPDESVYENIRPIKDIKWRYEMELDFDGNPSFYISTDYELPFGVMLNNNGNSFEITDEISDYIAFGVQFTELGVETISQEGYEYCFSNLSQNDSGAWHKEILFQQVGERYYHQVNTPLEGKHYVKLIKKGIRGIEKLTNGWSQSQIRIEGYEVYKIDAYTVSTPKARQNNKNLVDDRFKLYGVGTWFGIQLEEGQHIYWNPDLVGNDGKEKEIESLIQAPNGKTYFRLSRNNVKYIRGNLIIKDNNGGEILSEQIKDVFHWDGFKTKYGYNEWGEVIENGSINHTNATSKAKHSIPDSKETHSAKNPDMIIQILYDIADENGCVTRQKLKDALNYIMDFHNIVPTPNNRRSLIYALRRLGYIVAYKEGRNYINQLVDPFLEKTNYSFDTANNVYLVKGIYCQEDIQELKNNGKVKYKKPYSKESLEYNPEYICLPDLILLQLNNIGNWKVVDHPIAYDYIEAMADMNVFEERFMIRENGDIYIGARDFDVPCMIKDNGEEKLCVKNSKGQIVLRETYHGKDYINRPIPKQLSRIYCQNGKRQPIIFFRSYKADGKIRLDNNNLTILKSMGKPALFDMALCDLNLGIPQTNRCFVVDIDNANLPYDRGSIYSLGTTYNTAYSAEEVRKGLVKIGCRDMTDPFQSSSIFVYPYDIHYRMKLIDPKAHKITLALYWEHEALPEAFSIGTRVYCKTPDRRYREILGDNSVNVKFSSVINRTEVTFGNCFEGDLSFLNNNKSKEVIIIKKA